MFKLFLLLKKNSIEHKGLLKNVECPLFLNDILLSYVDNKAVP